MTPRSVLLLLLTAPAACAFADGERSRIEVVDSAGIQLVRNGAAPAYVLEPDLDIGMVEGPEELQFHRVSALAVDPAGSIFVADGSSTIRQFDSAGSYVRHFGRRGEGPGEFQYVTRIFLYGDTVAVLDGDLARVTELDGAGAVISTLPYRAERRIRLPVARLDGAWLVQPYEPAWRLEVGKARRDTTRLVHATSSQIADPAARDLRDIVQYEGARVYGIASAQGGMTANTPLFEPTPARAVDDSGNIYISRSNPYIIDVYDADGVLWRRITRSYMPVRVTDDLVDRYWEKIRLYLDTTTSRHGEWSITVDAELGRQSLPVNETLPALGRLIVSPEGVLWVQRPDMAPDPLLLEYTHERTRQDTFWDVFDHEGRLIANVKLPAAFYARTARDRSIYGVLRDELDVEHIARFTLPDAR